MNTIGYLNNETSEIKKIVSEIDAFLEKHFLTQALNGDMNEDVTKLLKYRIRKTLHAIVNARIEANFVGYQMLNRVVEQLENELNQELEEGNSELATNCADAAII